MIREGDFRISAGHPDGDRQRLRGATHESLRGQCEALRETIAGRRQQAPRSMGERRRSPARGSHPVRGGTSQRAATGGRRGPLDPDPQGATQPAAWQAVSRLPSTTALRASCGAKERSGQCSETPSPPKCGYLRGSGQLGVEPARSSDHGHHVHLSSHIEHSVIRHEMLGSFFISSGLARGPLPSWQKGGGVFLLQVCISFST